MSTDAKAADAVVEEKPSAGAPAGDKPAAAVPDASADAKPDAAAKPAAPAAKPKSSVLDDVDDADDEGGAGDEGAKPEGDKPDGDKPAVAGDFPDDWREKLAKGDDKKLARLKRYASVEQALLAGFAAQDKIRSGDYKQAELAEDATPEEKKAYYEERGIPVEAKDYDIPKVAGHQWTEADTPVLNGFKEVAHSLMIPQAAMNGITEWFARTIDAQKEAAENARIAQDKASAENLSDALRADLGAEYKPTLALMKRLLNDPEHMPDDLGTMLLSARTDDGTRLINVPAFTKLLAQMSRDAYGDGGFISGDAAAKHSSRKAEIERIMKTDMKKYYDDGLDKEYLEIIAKEKSMNRRGRAA